MNLLSDTENVIVIPCLKEHLLPKMPCLSCQEPSHQFQARNCRESTCYPQPKCDNITNLQPPDWPDSTKQYCHIILSHTHGTTYESGLSNLSATFLILNVLFQKHKHKTLQRQMVKDTGSKTLFYKFRTLAIMATTQFLFIRQELS